MKKRANRLQRTCDCVSAERRGSHEDELQVRKEQNLPNGFCFAAETECLDASPHELQLGRVAREQVLQRLADVVVDPAAFFDSSDDSREVVIGDNHVGGLFGHLGTVRPMAMPMSAPLIAGASLPPSPVIFSQYEAGGHGHQREVGADNFG